jgi:hypothetical protein
VQQADLGSEHLGALVATLRALGRDRQRLIERLGHQLVELLPTFLVKLHWRAREHDLRVLQRAGIRRRREIRDQLLDRLARQLLAQA